MGVYDGCDGLGGCLRLGSSLDWVIIGSVGVSLSKTMMAAGLMGTRRLGGAKHSTVMSGWRAIP